MRVLFALLALLGLLLSPVAASAAAVSCLHHHGDGQMVMAMDAAQAGQSAEESGHGCCDEDERPVQHDEETCAQACMVMCGVGGAMPVASAERIAAGRLAALKPPPPNVLRGEAPPGPDHPPKPTV